MPEDESRLQGKAAEFARVLRERLPDLREQYGVESIGIFGSYGRGEQTKGSDLDVLVDFNRPIGLFGFVGLQQELSDTLGVRVDLVLERGLKIELGKNILAEVVRV